MIACPICGAKTTVVETRISQTSARRRRRCTSISGCPGKVSTIEMVVPDGRFSTRPSIIGDGSVLVPARMIERLKEILEAICGESP